MTEARFPTLSDERRRHLLDPPQGPLRMVLDTDAHNEIDDQFAIAWALMSQDTLDIEGMYAAPYSFAFQRRPLLAAYDLLRADRNANVPDELSAYAAWARRLLAAGIDAHGLEFVDPAAGMELSYQEIVKIYDLLGESSDDEVFRGSPGYLPSLDEPLRSPAAEHLIERALAADDRPLYVAAIGCLSNIASAILLEPEIIQHIVVLWTAGYPSTATLDNTLSFNLAQDVLAAQLLFDCGVPLVYLPGFQVGAQLKVSLPEMRAWVRGRGPIGDYLFHLYTHNPLLAQQGIVDLYGRTWVIWDLITIAWLLNPAWVPSQLVPTPRLSEGLTWRPDPARPLMREAYDIDRDTIFRDFFRKLTRRFLP